MKNFDEMLLKFGESRDMSAGFSVNALRIDKPNKEEALKKFTTISAVALMSPAGERTISSVSLYGIGGSDLTFSLFTKVNVEPGKIKYVGDIVVFDPLKMNFWHPQTYNPTFEYKYLPDAFHDKLQKNCPKLSSNLIFEELLLKHK